MVILIVDNDLDRLHELEQSVQGAFPDETVFAYQDPLMAGKYSFNHPVDILIAGVVMKRMDGLQMSSFVRMTNPNAKVYLHGSQSEFEKSIILEDENINGQLVRPVTGKALRKIAMEVG